MSTIKYVNKESSKEEQTMSTIKHETNASNLSKLFEEVKTQASKKKDYLADFTKVEDVVYDPETKDLNTTLEGQVITFSPRYYGLLSRAAGMNLPAKTLATLLESNSAQTITAIKDAMKNVGRKQMVRTLDNNARGVLPPNYKRVNHEQLEDLIKSFDLNNVKYQLDDNNLEVRLSTAAANKETISLGEAFACGVLITNNEAGKGPQVRPYIERLICTNGATATETDKASFMIVHPDFKKLGKVLLEGAIRDIGEPAEFLFDNGIINYDFIKESLDETLISISQRISNQTKVTEADAREILRKLKVNNTETKEIIQRFSNAPDSESFTDWALINGISSVARDTENSYRRNLLETITYKAYRDGIFAVAA